MWRMDVQRGRYGNHLYIKDDEGQYHCFFKGCGQRYKANFSRHVEGHEKKGDVVDEELSNALLSKYKDHPEMSHPRQKFRISKRSKDLPMEFCKKALDSLKKHPNVGHFLAPVDPIASGAVNYLQVIALPMDLGTVEAKLSATGEPGEKSSGYKSAEEFATDVRLVWSNAKQYNGEGSSMWEIANELSMIFESKLEKYKISTEYSHTDKRLANRFPTTDISNAWPFLEPVDADRLELPSYSKIIKRPMDLSTLWIHLCQGHYQSYSTFMTDFRLIFRNALVYNDSDSQISEFATELAALFEAEVENALHKNYELSRRLNAALCVRDPLTRRMLFWDEERSQYYFEFFDTEDEYAPVIDGPLNKVPKLNDDGTEDDDSLPVQRRECTARPGDAVWAAWRPKGTPSRGVAATASSSSSARRSRPSNAKSMSMADEADEIIPTSSRSRNRKAKRPIQEEPITPGGYSEALTPGVYADSQTNPSPASHTSGGSRAPRTPASELHSVDDEDEDADVMDEDDGDAMDLDKPAPAPKPVTPAANAVVHPPQAHVQTAPKTPTTPSWTPPPSQHTHQAPQHQPPPVQQYQQPVHQQPPAAQQYQQPVHHQPVQPTVAPAAAPAASPATATAIGGRLKIVLPRPPGSQPRPPAPGGPPPSSFQ